MPFKGNSIDEKSIMWWVFKQSTWKKERKKIETTPIFIFDQDSSWQREQLEDLFIIKSILPRVELKYIYSVNGTVYVLKGKARYLFSLWVDTFSSFSLGLANWRTLSADLEFGLSKRRTLGETADFFVSRKRRTKLKKCLFGGLTWRTLKKVLGDRNQEGICCIFPHLF